MNCTVFNRDTCKSVIQRRNILKNEKDDKESTCNRPHRNDDYSKLIACSSTIYPHM